MVVLTAVADARTDQATGAKSVNQYRLLSEAGRGAFCKVKWAEDASGRPLAVKVFSKSVLERRAVSFFDKDGASTVPLRSRIDEELRILGELSHSNVMALEEVIDDPNHEKMYAVMEGLPGGQLMTWDEDLSAYSATSKTDAVKEHWGDQVQYGSIRPDPDSGACVYREHVAAFLLRQLLGGTEYLHAQGIIHKDLKPDNILLTLPIPCGDPRFVGLLSLDGWPELNAASPAAEASDVQSLLDPSRLVAKIGDFNSAAACPQPDCLIYDAEGTQQFTPPECFEGRSGGLRGKPRDMWSLGCVLFTMLFGRCPFWAEQPIMLQIMIMTEQLVIPKGVASPGAEDLIRALMQKDPTARPCATAALQLAWLQRASPDEAGSGSNSA